MRERARALFHAPPQNLNCAQAVLAAYQEASGDQALDLQAFQAHGGGRAPGGLCGALHAACAIHPEAAEALRNGFLQEVGHLDCASIRVRGLDACRDCVGLAVGLLAQGILG